MKVRAFFGYHLSDFIYGATDGIVTTFAVVSGAAGAGFSNTVVIVLGIANLIADGFSMGASRYISLKSEKEFVDAEGGTQSPRNPLHDGSATFLAFVVAGFLPLVPFAFNLFPDYKFLVSAISTGIAFWLVGSARSLLTKKSPWRSGLEMLLIGGGAAALAYSLGMLLGNLIGVEGAVH